jgi:hypothetical protein
MFLQCSCKKTGNFACKWSLACAKFASMFLMFLFGICFLLAACDATVKLTVAITLKEQWKTQL